MNRSLEVQLNGMYYAKSVGGMALNELLLTSGRAAAVFVLMLLVVRSLGSRTIGNFSAFDLLVALMLGEVVDEIIFGDVRFLQGTVAIVVIAALAHLDAVLSYLGRPWSDVLEGKPTVIVRDGEFARDGMRKERMNQLDVLSHLRIQGIRDMREVHLAVVENDGNVSVLRQTWADSAQKADLLQEEHGARLRRIGSEDTPPPMKRTDSPQALHQD
jgi:uncharacterized membrane protein YcaP (DUF421 family)